MKSPESSDLLDSYHHLLTSAAAIVESFCGQWSTVAAIHGCLHAALDDLSDLPSHSHPLATDLLRSLSQTLSLTLTLLCRSPPGGKLRTQSDINPTSATLSQLVAVADLLYTGTLLDPPIASQAMATAAPGTSLQESVCSEARSLMTCLQIESPVSRIAVLDSFIILL